MNIDPSRAIDTIQRIINGFFALLPKLAIAVVLVPSPGPTVSEWRPSI
jgi:hypothetical protein